MKLFRADLLNERVVALAGARDDAIATALSEVGAVTVRFDDDLDEQAAQEWAAAAAPLHALVYDAAAAFTRGGLEQALDRAWGAVRAIAAGALIPGQAGGRVILIGPREGAGPYAAAARDALENLARTLSVEWARYGITATMIAPGASTADRELAALVGYLVSPAGGYLSGCRFSLRTYN